MQLRDECETDRKVGNKKTVKRPCKVEQKKVIILIDHNYISSVYWYLQLKSEFRLIKLLIVIKHELYNCSWVFNKALGEIMQALGNLLFSPVELALYFYPFNV